MTVVVRPAQKQDLESIKRLADQNRDALGFLPRAKVEESISANRVLLATIENEVIGFVIYRHRKIDRQTTLSDICVDHKQRSCGVGTALLQALLDQCNTLNRDCIRLKCPEGLAANSFYKNAGFQNVTSEKGRNRKLLVWQFSISPSEAV